MSLTKKFETNAAAITKGVPVSLPANDDGSIPTFYIARMHSSNQRYQNAVKNALKPYKFEVDHGTLPDSTAEAVMMGVFSKVIVTGMENVLLSDVTGKETDKGFAEYNSANVESLMKRLPELYELLQTKAKDAAAFLKHQDDVTAGNS